MLQLTTLFYSTFWWCHGKIALKTESRYKTCVILVGGAREEKRLQLRLCRAGKWKRPFWPSLDWPSYLQNEKAASTIVWMGEKVLIGYRFPNLNSPTLKREIPTIFSKLYFGQWVKMNVLTPWQCWNLFWYQGNFESLKDQSKLALITITKKINLVLVHFYKERFWLGAQY